MTRLTLAQIADLVDGTLRGDPNLEITGTGIIRDAVAGEITFAIGQQQVALLSGSQAAAAIIPRGEEHADLHVIEVDSPEEAFIQLVRHFRPPASSRVSGISPAAEVHPSARIADDVTIEAGAVIGPEVEIGRGSHIHGGVQVMSRVTIGEECQVFPQVTLYDETVIGNRVLIHAGATLGAFGFGYRPSPEGLELCAQLGNVVVEDDVEIGAATTIDRGTYGATTIGAGTKIDNQVQIGHNCRIGKHNLLCAQVGIAGSTTTGDGVVMAGQVGVKDHIEVGDGVRIGAQAGIMDDLEAGMTYVGSPAMPERKQMRIFAVLRQLPELRKQVRELQRELDEVRQQLAEDDPSIQDAA